MAGSKKVDRQPRKRRRKGGDKYGDGALEEKLPAAAGPGPQPRDAPGQGSTLTDVLLSP
jgi:hypothetical protein